MVRRGHAAFRVAAGEVQQVDPCEDDEEAGEEGEDVDSVGGVEAAIENEGGAEGCGCECYIVQRIHTVISCQYRVQQCGCCLTWM